MTLNSGREIPVDIKVPSTPMRRDFFRPFVTKAAQVFKRAEFKTDHDKTLKPLSFNDFIVKHTQILMEDPAADDHFPPQRAQMLYDMYKRLLSEGDKKVVRYHKKLKDIKTPNPDSGQNKQAMARRIITRLTIADDRESFTWTEPAPRNRTRQRFHQRRDRPGVPAEDKVDPEEFAVEGETVEVFENGGWKKKPFKKTMAPLVEKGQVRKY